MKPYVPWIVAGCAIGVALALAFTRCGQTQSSPADTGKLEALEKERLALTAQLTPMGKRLEALEQGAAARPTVAADTTPPSAPTPNKPPVRPKQNDGAKVDPRAKPAAPGPGVNPNPGSRMEPWMRVGTREAYKAAVETVAAIEPGAQSVIR